MYLEMHPILLLYLEVSPILKWRRGHYLGEVSNLPIINFGIGPVSIFSASFIAEMDPFSVSLAYLWHYKEQSCIVRLCCRHFTSIWSTITGIEACRTLRIGFTCMALAAVCTSIHVANLRKEFQKSTALTALHEYQRFQRIRNMQYQPSAGIAFTSYQCGTLFVVLTLTRSLIDWQFWSPMEYYIARFMATLPIIIIVVVMEFAVKC